MKFLLALLAGASMAALPVALAGAQDQKPAPMYCVGEAMTDKTGDLLDLSPLPAFGPNTDIKSFFFRYVPGADGKPVLTANLVIADLTKTNYSDLATMEWEVVYTVDDRVRVAGAHLKPTGDLSFYDGSYYLDDETAPGPPAESTGRLIEGKDGVVEIVITGADALKGKTLKNVWARTKAAVFPVEHQSPLGYVPDRAPDAADKYGKDFVVQECPPEPVAPTETTPTETTPDPSQQQQQPPQQQPQQQPQPQQPMQIGPPAPGQPLPATGTLTADAAADKGKRKTVRKRGLRARVRCSVQCKVTASAKITKKVARKLKLGRKAITIGKGKVTITKAGRIKFYVKMTKKAKRALKRKGVKKFALKVSFTVTDMQGGQAKRITKKSTLR